MTHEIAEHLEAVGSEIEASLATYDDHVAVAETLETLASMVRYVAHAKRARLEGRIVDAVQLEAYAQRAYDALPKEVQW